MKSFVLLATLASAAFAIESSNPAVTRTVQLIEDLKSKVLADGKAEQEGYDKYACWCEKTLQNKAAAIAAAKETIGETQTLIKKLKGEIASHGAEIDQLDKDIAQNKEAVKEATAVRDKEYADYAGEKTESEQCIGALEAAITVLTGAGTKAGFLQSIQEAQLLSVVGGVRSVLSQKTSVSKISDKDMELLNQFISQPAQFVHKNGMSAAQVGNNPFGDYAPQSTQIQGILKGMYDAFTAELEKDNADEADAQKAFEELLATKTKEFKTLDATLMKQEADKASKEKLLSESEVLLDDTVATLQADEAFFADTKDACEVKAKEWSVRTRLRTEELAGMEQAIGILTSPEAKKIFQDSSTTFLQLASVKRHTSKSKADLARAHAFDRLRKLAAEQKSRPLAAIAIEVQNMEGGHFDKVIAMIDDMMVLLRKEEQEDIEHKDRCENGQNGNKNELEDLQHSIDKTQASLDRMANTKKDLDGEIKQTKADIRSTEDDMAELLDMRNKESDAFKQALKDDTDAKALIEAATAALMKFYKNNKAAAAFMQGKAPEYTEDPEKAPDAGWEGSDYGGRKSENTGIVAILEMLAEDLAKEIADGRADDAAAQEKYLEQNGALTKTLETQKDTLSSLETELADLMAKMDDYEKFKDGKEADQKAENDKKKALATDCDWVGSHFELRRQKRKTEMEGLVDAKAALAEGNNR